MATKMPGPDTDIPWVQEEKREPAKHTYIPTTMSFFASGQIQFVLGISKCFGTAWLGFWFIFLRRWAYSVVGLGFLLGLVS